MSKFLKFTGAIGVGACLFLVIKEKKKYDSLSDKSQYNFFGNMQKSPEKIEEDEKFEQLLDYLSRAYQMPLDQQLKRWEMLSGNTRVDVSELPAPEFKEVDPFPFKIEECNEPQPYNIYPEIYGDLPAKTGAKANSHEASYDVLDLLKDGEIITADSLNTDNVVEKDSSHVSKEILSSDQSSKVIDVQEILDVKDDIVKDSTAVDPVESFGEEKEAEKDTENVVDVKLAFSKEKNHRETVLDPKIDFVDHKVEFSGSDTLNGLSKNCMELGIVLGELMAEIPEAQPRLNHVYGELKQLFENVSNLQREQDDLISKALQNQGSEFTQVLEQQWESSVQAMAFQAHELEQEYSEKLSEFKVLLTNQMQQEEKEKLDKIKKEYELDKANALVSQELELVRSWESIVAEKVDQERDGRLAKLDHLAAKVQVLQNVTEDMATRLEKQYKLKKVDRALNKLFDALIKSPKSIENEFNQFWLAGSKYPFIRTILSTLPKDIAIKGVPEFSELFESFGNVRRRINGIKYMPENGGIISYFISSFGPSSRIGEITNEVLYNSSEHLLRGDLDSAARQMNRLRGWQRELALEWIAEARRYLEFKQAIDVINDYVRLEGLEVL